MYIFYGEGVRLDMTCPSCFLRFYEGKPSLRTAFSFIVLKFHFFMPFNNNMYIFIAQTSMWIYSVALFNITEMN